MIKDMIITFEFDYEGRHFKDGIWFFKSGNEVKELSDSHLHAVFEVTERLMRDTLQLAQAAKPEDAG